MNTHTGKRNVNKRGAAIGEVFQKRVENKSNLQFIGASQESITQMRLQEIVDNSQQVQQLKSFQELVNKISSAKSVAQPSMVVKGDNKDVVQRIMEFPNLEGDGGSFPGDSIYKMDIDAIKSGKPNGNPFSKNEVFRTSTGNADNLPVEVDGKDEGKFIFAKRDGVLNIGKGPGIHHNDLASGKSVEYAGTIEYIKGVISKWTNNSGHYQPGVKWVDQAGLPRGSFEAHGESQWDDIIDEERKIFTGYSNRKKIKHYDIYKYSEEEQEWVIIRNEVEHYDYETGDYVSKENNTL